ncbi:MAG TPA: VOC family protein [Ilumatobacteraceae bacterium]|nr:VOC family protein [Ilumatobacteraceae bacterium]HRB02502.1 VOC family protein [Ilumatobacteraceae bacterium]
MSITRLNHAVLYVSDARASATFYGEVLGFETVANIGNQAFFLRADGSANDHDLGLFSVGNRPAAAHSVGLYHLAWQVPTLQDLVALRERLVAAGSLIGESDHGVSKSLYAKDLDGIEFEIMWAVPKADWPADLRTLPLDLDASLQRWAGVDTSAQ